MEKRTFVNFENTEVAFSNKSNSELRKAFILFLFMNWDKTAKVGIKFIKTAINIGFPINALIKGNIFKQFCGGESVEECKKTIYSLDNQKVYTILDYAVEGASTQVQFEQNCSMMHDLIELDDTNQAIAYSVFKVSSLCTSDLLAQLQNNKIHTNEDKEALNLLVSRLNKISNLAFDKKIKLLVDAEESWIQGAIHQLTNEAMKKFNTGEAIIFNTFQMYRKDMLEILKKETIEAQGGNYILGVKLVRGAYMEKERARAIANNYPSPIHDHKEATDKAFNEALKWCVEHIQHIELCCGTHNEESNQLLAHYISEAQLTNNDQRIFFAQLYGMSDHITFNLAQHGFNVAKYLPFGPIESVLPYLFRRAEENKSIGGQASRELSLVKRELKRRKS